MFTVLFSIVTAAMLNVSEPMKNNYVAEECALTTEWSYQDKSLGPVNLCDPNGVTCFVGTAYQDAESGRIYVNVGRSTKKDYAQKSNDSRWQYMIRYENNWYYFSF